MSIYPRVVSSRRRSKGEKSVHSVINELQFNTYTGQRSSKTSAVDSQWKDTVEKDKIIANLKRDILKKDREVADLKETLYNLPKLIPDYRTTDYSESEDPGAAGCTTLSQRIKMWMTKAGSTINGRKSFASNHIIKRSNVILRSTNDITPLGVCDDHINDEDVSMKTNSAPLPKATNAEVTLDRNMHPSKIQPITDGINFQDVGCGESTDQEEDLRSLASVQTIDCESFDSVESMVPFSKVFAQETADSNSFTQRQCSQQDEIKSTSVAASLVLVVDAPSPGRRRRAVSVSFAQEIANSKPAASKAAISVSRAGDLINSSLWTPDSQAWSMQWENDNSSSGDSEDSGFGDTGFTLGAENSIDHEHDEDGSPSAAISIASILTSDNRYISPSMLARLAAAAALEARAEELYQVLVDELNMFRHELGYK